MRRPEIFCVVHVSVLLPSHRRPVRCFAEKDKSCANKTDLVSLMLFSCIVHHEVAHSAIYSCKRRVRCKSETCWKMGVALVTCHARVSFTRGCFFPYTQPAPGASGFRVALTLMERIGGNNVSRKIFSNVSHINRKRDTVIKQLTCLKRSFKFAAILTTKMGTEARNPDVQVHATRNRRRRQSMLDEAEKYKDTNTQRPCCCIRSLPAVGEIMCPAVAGRPHNRSLPTEVLAFLFGSDLHTIEQFLHLRYFRTGRALAHLHQYCTRMSRLVVVGIRQDKEQTAACYLSTITPKLHGLVWKLL